MVKQFYFAHALIVFIYFFLAPVAAQSQIAFNKKLELGAPFKNFGQAITGIAQDPRGFIWITSRQGLHRYDGFSRKDFRHNPLDSNTLGFNYADCIYIDEQNIIWIGSKGSGLDRYDPFLNSFTHFRHDSTDQGSISNDTVTSIIKDNKGMLWIGTRNGLNMFDQRTLKFRSFFAEPGKENSISNNSVITLYEDRDNILWIGCGSNDIEREPGGLNRFNRSTGDFTSYLHENGKANSIEKGGISALYEDSRGSFWIGTVGAGVQLMDKASGSFSHLAADPLHPGKEDLPGHKKLHNIKFIGEDVQEGIWIGSANGGINRIDPGTGRPTHYGTSFIDDLNFRRDTTEGFLHYYPWRMLSSKDGLLWVVTADGGMYNINLSTSAPRFYDMPGISVLCFLLEPGEEVLWIGTNKGLVRRDLLKQKEKTFTFDDITSNFSGANTVNSIKLDTRGKLWIGTNNGLVVFDTATAKTRTFRNDPRNNTSIAGNGIYSLMFDGENHIWVGTDHGLDKLDLKKEEFLHYKKARQGPKVTSHVVYDLAMDKNNDLWQGTSSGLEKYSPKTGKVSRYLPNLSIWCVFIDSDDGIWTTSSSGLFLYDPKTDQFKEFLNPKSKERFYDIIDIIEDRKKFMWVRAPKEIIRISPDKTEVRSLSLRSGVKECNPIFDRFNIIDEKGRIYMVADGGFHRFHPNDFLTSSNILPLVFTSLHVNNREVKPGGDEGILKLPISKVSGINLEHDQNDFFIDFTSFDYTEDEELTYQVRLEHYDKDWRQLGTYNRAEYYNIPPGTYILHARAMNSEGFFSDKALRIDVGRPWWGTWWAYMIYAAVLISIPVVFVWWRTYGIRKRNTALERKVILRTEQLKIEKEKVELTLEELKATQEQLILKEKLASLGEMTTGIAHEIQNPLNFVNNFSEVNKDLIEELKEEMNTGSAQSAREILDDLGANTERIHFHGKRADQIVKSMFLLTRGGNGQKKPTDIVALADEYMWRAFDSFKSKNCSFDACVNMDFKTELGHHSLVPNDMGRVLMNLYDNAFFAVHEKKNQLADTFPSLPYEPVVTVSAEEDDGNLTISIIDNGNGIPEKLKGKIFQPFFTTKPTGQGTGLGLSMCYDIVKAHGGEIKVESQEGVGSAFYIIIPLSNT